MTADDKLKQLTIASRRAASVENTSVLVDEAVAPVVKGLRMNGILTGGGILGTGGFLLWCMVTLTSVQTAQAQAKSETEKNSEAIVELKASRTETNSRLGALERIAIRSEAMQEMALRNQGITPPPKLDAGTDGGR